MNQDLADRIAATIRRVDGDHTMGAGVLAEAIAEDLGDVEARAALAERVRIEAEIYAFGEKLQREAADRGIGTAAYAIVQSVGGRIGKMPKPGED